MACSGAGESLFASGTDGDGAGGSAAAVGGSSGTATGGAMSSTQASSSRSSTSSSVSQTSATQAATSVSVATTGVGGSPPMVEIPCGADVCVAGEVCCLEQFGGRAPACSAPGTCTAAQTEIYCNNAVDCPAGEVCCGQFNNQTGYSLLECTASCPDFVMCFDDPGACDPNETCNDSNWLPMGYQWCGG